MTCPEDETTPEGAARLGARGERRGGSEGARPAPADAGADAGVGEPSGAQRASASITAVLPMEPGWRSRVLWMAAGMQGVSFAPARFERVERGGPPS